MTKVLVTGGTGFLGSALVNQLIKKNYKVYIFDNNFRGSLKNINSFKKKVKFIKGDIRNFNSINKALKGINEVYHLAFINGTSNFYKFPKLVLDVGIRGTLNLMDGINKNKSVKKFIYASSSEVYQNPKAFPTKENVDIKISNTFNPRYSYASSKILGEIMTYNYLRSDIKKLIFRPHNIYGPSMGFEHVIPQIVKKIYLASNKLRKKNVKINIQGSGKETRSFCYIDDAAKGIYLISKKGKNNEIYNLGRKEEVNILKLIQDISSILDIKIKINKKSLTFGSTTRRVPDLNKLRKLGYKQKITLKEGLKSTVEWYINYFKKNV